MKKLLRFIQGIGFSLFMLGGMAADSNIVIASVLVISGLAVMIGFLKIENNYCFDEHEKRPCRRPKHRAQNNTRNAISMLIMAWRKGKVNGNLSDGT